MNESCQKYGWVMSHVWLSHVTYTNESCHTYEWVISHIWMSHATRMNQSYHTHGWVVSHIWMSHAVHMTEVVPQKESYEYLQICRVIRIYHMCIWVVQSHLIHTYEWVTSHICNSSYITISSSCDVCPDGTAPYRPHDFEGSHFHFPNAFPAAVYVV